MKYLLLILAAITLVGCRERHEQIDEVAHFTYQNHDYIEFIEYNGYSAAGGVVHDPECRLCKSQKTKITSWKPEKIIKFAQ